MRVQAIAVACAFVLCAAASGVASIPAAAQEPTRGQEQAGDQCRAECQAEKDDRDAICRGLPTRKAREKCWRSSNELYAKCAAKCEAGPLMLERKIDYTPTSGGPTTVITVRVIEVQPDGADWSAILEITGFHEEHRQRFHGTDSMSAALSAVRMAPVVLRSLAGPGTLTWLGEEDLGFDLTPFGAEPNAEAAAREMAL